MKPKALDLFCCAGGISTGLQRAGFEVTGVDINPQPHYRGGTFLQADALQLLRDQAIPPPYAEFIGRAALNYLSHLPGSSRLPA